jgi:hypothetical protein
VVVMVAKVIRNVWYRDGHYQKMGLMLGESGDSYIINPYAGKEILKIKKNDVEVVDDAALEKKQF